MGQWQLVMTHWAQRQPLLSDRQPVQQNAATWSPHIDAAYRETGGIPEPRKPTVSHQPRYPKTVYLSARHLIALVRRKGLSACIAGVAERIEADYLRWNEFDKTARVASHSEVGVIELMPIADAAQFAFKYVNGHPTNHRHGLPTVMAFGVLADVATGAPRLLSELTLTTAIRTAAMSALAARVLTPEMIEPGMHVNAVGGDCPGKTELHRGVLEAASVFVEFEPQTRIEGDIQQMPADFAVTEFWRVLSGQAPGRTGTAQVTVFDSVGFALEDYSAMTFMRDVATELGIGEVVELVPEAADPKNLFGVLRDEPKPAAAQAAAPVCGTAEIV